MYTPKTETDEAIAAAELQGEKGDKGDKGDAGDAATITVGTVTTGAAGTSASVTNSGTSSAAVLNFTIPKGDAGASASYTLPTASASTLGGVKVGDCLSISSGVLSVSSLPIDSTYVSDADSFNTKTGYAKTNTSTTNLPDACNDGEVWDDGRWGVLQMLCENATQGNGIQLYFPVAGSTMGKMFMRSHGGSTGWSDWVCVLREGDVYSNSEVDALIAAAGSGTSSYTLPVATTSVLGGIKSSSTLTVASDGTASVASAPKASAIDGNVFVRIKDASGAHASALTSWTITGGKEMTSLSLPATITATLVGNADTATRATQDADGNVISTTYLKTVNLPTALENPNALAVSITKNGVTSTYSYDGSERITVPITEYTLPTASSTTLGGVKVGDGLSISNGVLSATGTGSSVDLSNYYTKTECDSAISTAIAAITNGDEVSY